MQVFRRDLTRPRRLTRSDRHLEPDLTDGQSILPSGNEAITAMISVIDGRVSGLGGSQRRNMRPSRSTTASAPSWRVSWVGRRSRRPRTISRAYMASVPGDQTLRAEPRPAPSRWYRPRSVSASTGKGTPRRPRMPRAGVVPGRRSRRREGRRRADRGDRARRSRVPDKAVKPDGDATRAAVACRVDR